MSNPAEPRHDLSGALKSDVDGEAVTRLADAFAAIADERPATALPLLRQADARGSRMAAALLRHLAGEGPDHAYAAHAAFQAFIRGRRQRSRSYAAVEHGDGRTPCAAGRWHRLLDIGAGDGDGAIAGAACRHAAA